MRRGAAAPGQRERGRAAGSERRGSERRGPERRGRRLKPADCDDYADQCAGVLKCGAAFDGCPAGYERRGEHSRLRGGTRCSAVPLRRRGQRANGWRKREFACQSSNGQRECEKARRFETIERGGELRGRYVRFRRQEESLVTPRVHGVGLGLRWEFIDELVERTQEAESVGEAPLPLDFLEVSPENYMRRGGKYPAALAWLAERYPVVTHGLTMSLGGTDTIDPAYVNDLSSMLRAVKTPWHSDHLCFSSVDGRALHELLPVPYKRSGVFRIAERIRRAQDMLDLPIAIENVSAYWHPGRAEMTEAEFLAGVCEAADCSLLLDVNNAYVNATNFGFNVHEWMRAIPIERVIEIHVAGHEWFEVDQDGLGDRRTDGGAGAMIIDTHGAETPSPVLELLEHALAQTGRVPVVLERDQNVPSLDTLLAEVAKIRALWRESPRLVARSE